MGTLSLSSSTGLSKVRAKPAALALFPVRAKYFHDSEGNLRLANVCSFSRPVFNPGYVPHEDKPPKRCTENGASDEEAQPSADDIRRAVRRAKLRVFDLVLANRFKVFTTLTFSAEHVDRSSYEEVYGKLRVWLSNRVQRDGLAYVAVPEYHKDGENIHFHMLSNDAGLQLVDSGHVRNGKKVYNVSSWGWGFSTAQRISGSAAAVRTAKYIWKYMGKNMGAKVGGRYYLSGGKLQEPVFKYFEDVSEIGFGEDEVKSRYEFETEGGFYREWSFI